MDLAGPCECKSGRELPEAAGPASGMRTSGVFGVDMKVALVNDSTVTIWLNT